MRSIIAVLFFLILLSACSSELDNIKFNDNPYDNDYTGEKVVRITSIDTLHSSSGAAYTVISYSKSYPYNDGVRLFRNGISIVTISSQSDNWHFNDPSAVSGVTYTYEVELFLGQGKTRSLPYVYTTP